MSWPVILWLSVPTVVSFTSLSRCSTPTCVEKLILFQCRVDGAEYVRLFENQLDLLCLLSSNLCGNMFKSLLSRGAVVMDLLHNLEEDLHKPDFEELSNLVGLGGQPDPGGLGVDDDQDGVGAVLPNQVVDQDVVLVQLWPRVVPADNALLGVHLPTGWGHV